MFDIRIYSIRRRASRRRPFEVRWHAAGRARSRSFLTRRLADSYRAELVRAARMGLEFDPATGEPVLWAAPEPDTTTWYRRALAYTDMKWPDLAAHSRASMAEALATVTPALTRATGKRPPAQVLRAALYGHAFNPQHQTRGPDPATAAALAWLERASLPVTRLQDPRVTRQALDALAVRLDGRRAAANTIARKRAVFHNALGYAVELGLLEVNPLGQHWRRTPRAASAADPRVTASPGQVGAILTQVTRIRPELTAFFGCLYYAALRPEEAVALRRDSLALPASGWGQLTLSAALPRSARAWTGNGTAHEPRGLKLRPDGATRTVPIPPQLVSLLRRHLRAHGSAPDGRLFRGARGGPLSESLYGRIWHQARAAASSSAQPVIHRVLRPYDLRHAALSLWLASGAPPAEIAARAGHSVTVLLAVYAHCIPGHDQVASRRIERALGVGSRPAAGPREHPGAGGSRPSCVRVTAGRSGTPLDPVRQASAGNPPVTCGNTRPRDPPYENVPWTPGSWPAPPQAADQARSGPPLAHRHRQRSAGPLPDTHQTRPPGTPAPGLTWGFCVAGVGFEPT